MKLSELKEIIQEHAEGVFPAERDIALAVNDRALSGDEWEMIAPYGDFPYTPEGSRISYVQRFHKDQAEIMVRNFNSIIAKLGRFFRGVPIYVGHPYQLPALYPDRRRIGNVMELQAREDGLYGRIKYNDLGRQNAEQGYYVYPTPGWHYAKPKPGEKFIYPEELDHVGLTNQPNIASSRPWTNEAFQAAAPAAEALHAPDPNEETMKLKDETRQRYMKMMGFAEGDTPDDEAINAKMNSLLDEHESLKERLKEGEAVNSKLLGHLNKIKKAALNEDEGSADMAYNEQLEAAVNEALTKITEVRGTAINEQSQLIELQTKLTESETAFTNERTERIKEKLDIAINEGRITKAEREGFETQLKQDFTGTLDILGKRGIALNTKPVDLSRSKEDHTSDRSVQQAILTAVNERQAADKCDYPTAYARVQKNEKYKPLFLALNELASAAKQL